MNKNTNYIIAEIGLNHNGSLDLCKKMINDASWSGCSAVKIQSLDWDSTTIEKNLNIQINLSENKIVNLKNYLKSLLLSKKDHKALRDYAKTQNIDIISTPFSLKWVNVLKELKFDMIKIASQDINNFPLIEHAAKTKLPIIISTGMSSLSEIINAVELIEKYHNKITILHCISNYPAKIKDMNLNRIITLKNTFKNYKIGLSDHSLGYDAAIISKTLGATFFEKHFTYDKEAEGFDHSISLNREEMKTYSKKILETVQALGKYDYSKILDIDNRKNMRRSVVTKKDLKKGDLINWSNIDFKRPYGGIDPNLAQHLIGRVVKKDIKKDNLLKLSHLY